jgi:alkanesulfonate monooxygenase SsuD/methylene tetrahydromethanopterin reductase-like flavin-dependent oxidoreductase (luciferase family)
VAAPVRLGLTLPSFQEDAEILLAVARAAEEAGVDGVFAYDHLFRGPRRRPALELCTTLGAVAGETSSIAFGSLVARASLRPVASLVAAFDTLERLGPGRFLAGIGSGDEESAPENEAYGLEEPDPLGSLEAAVRGAAGRGYPVWAGGLSPAVRRLAAGTADGWNAWGVSAKRFAAHVADVRSHLQAAGREAEGFTFSWGGLVVVGETQAEAERKAERLEAGPHVLVGGPERLAAALADYAAAGAAMVIAAPLDSSDPANAAVLGQAVAPLLR